MRVQEDAFLCHKSSSEGQLWLAGGASCKGVFTCPSGAADQVRAEKGAVWQQHATQQWRLAICKSDFLALLCRVSAQNLLQSAPQYQSRGLQQCTGMEEA